MAQPVGRPRASTSQVTTTKGPGRVKTYHPKIIGLKKFLKSCRSRNIDSVVSDAKISLSFQVQIHISEQYYLGWSESSTRIAYFELHEHEENYGVVKVMVPSRHFSNFVFSSFFLRNNYFS